MSSRWISIPALALLAFSSTDAAEAAEKKCSPRAADSLIRARYQDCKSKSMISYLHNNIITPYSFSCAKTIVETCKRENCANPNTPEEKERCEALYVGILETCTDQIEGAAKMARCRDTKVWPVAAREEEMEVIEEPAQEIPTTISGPEIGTQQPLRPEGKTRPPNRITEIIRSSQSTKRAGKKP